MSSKHQTLLWVIGAGGLLGKSLVSEANKRHSLKVFQTSSLPWGEAERLETVVRSKFQQFLREAESIDADWSVIWAAGSGTTSSQATDLQRQIEDFTIILKTIGGTAKVAPPSNLGSLFFSSSAGGVYGGSLAPPFSESSSPAPISPYGEAKLTMEEIAQKFAEDYSIPTVIGRIANIYGPGQNLNKMQGLISHLAKSNYSPTPAKIVVPLDTIRDYIYVDDCAKTVLNLMQGVPNILRDHDRSSMIKIIATGRGTSIADLLGMSRMIAKRRPNIVIGHSRQTGLQALDLSLRSELFTEFDEKNPRLLPEGINRTMLDVLTQIQH